MGFDYYQCFTQRIESIHKYTQPDDRTFEENMLLAAHNRIVTLEHELEKEQPDAAAQ